MNMSYGRFENTCIAMRDCIGAMEDSDDIPDMNLSKSERCALDNMKVHCQMFLDEYNRLEAASTAGEL